MPKDNPHLIARAWKSYKAEVMNADCPPTQYRECRFAFYAGVAAALHTLADPSLLGDVLGAIEAELAAWVNILAVDGVDDSGNPIQNA